jgi:hypothetical protein
MVYLMDKIASGEELLTKTVSVNAVLAIMAPMGFCSYCTLKLLFSRVTVLPQV